MPPKTSRPLRPSLDARLETILAWVQAQSHADIGCDHAKLPIRIVREGRAERCIAVELNPGPLAQARRSVARARLEAQIEVRQGDGFGPLSPGEVDSASLCGMGAHTIRRVLRAAQHLPPRLLLQCNDSAYLLRRWANEQGYHLETEVLVPGHWAYPALCLVRRAGPDPSYQGLPQASAWRYGPWLLRRGDELVKRQVQADLERLEPHALPGRGAWQEWREAKAAWALLLHRDRHRSRHQAHRLAIGEAREPALDHVLSGRQFE